MLGSFRGIAQGSSDASPVWDSLSGKVAFPLWLWQAGWTHLGPCAGSSCSAPQAQPGGANPSATLVPGAMSPVPVMVGKQAS